MNSVLSGISYYFIHNIHYTVYSTGITIYTIQYTGIFLPSRDFFQEKQSYLLTVSPLSKYEGGTDNPFDPSILQIKESWTLIHIKGTQSPDQQKTFHEVWLWLVKFTLKGHGKETDLLIFFHKTVQQGVSPEKLVSGLFITSSLKCYFEKLWLVWLGMVDVIAGH